MFEGGPFILPESKWTKGSPATGLLVYENCLTIVSTTTSAPGRQVKGACLRVRSFFSVGPNEMRPRVRETKAAFPLRTASIGSLRGFSRVVGFCRMQLKLWVGGKGVKRQQGALKWTWGSGVISGIHVLWSLQVFPFPFKPNQGGKGTITFSTPGRVA